MVAKILIMRYESKNGKFAVRADSTVYATLSPMNIHWLEENCTIVCRTYPSSLQRRSSCRTWSHPSQTHAHSSRWNSSLTTVGRCFSTPGKEIDGKRSFGVWVWEYESEYGHVWSIMRVWLHLVKHNALAPVLIYVDHPVDAHFIYNAALHDAILRRKHFWKLTKDIRNWNHFSTTPYHTLD